MDGLPTLPLRTFAQPAEVVKTDSDVLSPAEKVVLPVADDESNGRLHVTLVLRNHLAVERRGWVLQEEHRHGWLNAARARCVLRPSAACSIPACSVSGRSSQLVSANEDPGCVEGLRSWCPMLRLS